MDDVIQPSNNRCLVVYVITAHIEEEGGGRGLVEKQFRTPPPKNKNSYIRPCSERKSPVINVGQQLIDEASSIKFPQN